MNEGRTSVTEEGEKIKTHIRIERNGKINNVKCITHTSHIIHGGKNTFIHVIAFGWHCERRSTPSPKYAKQQNVVERAALAYMCVSA